MILRLLLTVLVLLPAVLRAEVPRVVADIAPVHSLVARIMAGVGEPALLLSPGASPHGYAMRPSEAAALQEADLVVWIGPGLTPSLARAMESLAAESRHLALLEAEGTNRLPVRASATFGHEDDGHGHDDAHHDQGAHAEHSDEHHAGHAHPGGHDPHAWLDPENARVWLDLIATELSAIDPENAPTYRDNAVAAQAELAALTEEIRARLAPVQDVPFLVHHDAYQYFERRFGLEAVGAVAVSDAAAPGAARMAELRDLVRATNPRCAFYEPQFSPGLIDTLAQGTGLQPAELDPIGRALIPGPDLYPALLRSLAEDIANCL